MEIEMTVFRKPLIVHLAVTAVALVGAASAFAQEATHEYDRPLMLHSDVSRAQVRADTLAFRASGELPSYSSKWHTRPPREKSIAARAQVRSETERALKAHEVINAGEVLALRPARAAQLAQR
jgi:hypothetical protein